MLVTIFRLPQTEGSTEEGLLKQKNKNWPHSSLAQFAVERVHYASVYMVYATECCGEIECHRGGQTWKGKQKYLDGRELECY
jgi:hypothetical protein